MSKENFQWDDNKVKELLRKTTSYVSDEHWTCVVEQFKKEQVAKSRDWEVLEFSCKYLGSDDVRFTRAKDGSYNTGLNCQFLTETEERLMANGKIHSVRRLLDQEVFVVGDNTHKGVIDSFVIDDKIDVLFAKFKDGKHLQLKFLQKVKKQVLFTTEDGVELFVGDTFYVVMEDYVYRHTSNESDIGKWVGVRKFSTNDLAKNYLLINKPLLSLEDLLSVWSDYRPDTNYYKEAPLFKKFEALAKSKLNQK